MKKLICCFLLIILFYSIFINSFNTYALTTLSQSVTESKISSGTLLKKYTLFTDLGWLNINVLEVDLKDKYTKIGLLTSSDGAGKLKNVLSLAQEAGAIAAINGDFFSGSSGKGHSIGLSINNSEIVSSAAKDNISKNTFSSFLLDEDNNAFFEYLTNTITLTSKRTRKSIEISDINKYSDNYSTPAIYTSDWGEYSIGSSDGFILTEFVVKNNKVTEIRYNEPAVKIPEDGFVISTLGEGAEFMNKNFKKNTKVELDIKLAPNIKDIEFAISGGAKLIENGCIPETFTHDVKGRNPRTALGIDEEEKTLFLVTVDGRQSSSIGMTQKELAEFLESINVYNAINLDGGGSTTMVAQNCGDFSLSTINNPSGGSLRNVINALGIFSKAPDSKKIYGLNIHIDDTNIFKGEERDIKVTAYNKYYNPIEIDFDEIKWDYNGVNLIIKDGKISGNTVGTSYLTASIGKIKKEIEINILSEVNELFISPKSFSANPNEKVSYTIKAKNKNGYYATTDLNTINSSILEFYSEGIKQSFIPDDAKIDNHKFTASTPGQYIIAFSKDSITSYATVFISSPKAFTLDDFESETFSFDEYPDEVSGKAYLSTEQVYSGKTSVKLEYDFNQDIQIRGAYIELKNPLLIPKDALSLSFWVYNDSEKEEKLKIKIKDANGITKLIVLENSLTHEGWKEINYDLSNINLPASISDIYLAQDNLDIKNSGYIYVDNLVYYSNSLNNNEIIKIPKDIKLEDHTNKDIQAPDSFDIALIDTFSEANLMIENLRNKTLINSINNNADITIVTEDARETLLKQIKTKTILLKNYDLIETENASFITLNISNKGIRLTDISQWENFQIDIKDSEKENIFIVLNDSIDNFSDLKERKLFVDILCELKRETKKNITVLHTGYNTDYSMERGVKFLGINTKNIPSELIASNFSYILISVVGDNISYKINKIF